MKKIVNYFKENLVLFVSLFICAAIIILCSVFAANVSKIANGMLDFFNSTFSWFYIICLPAFLIVLIIIAFSKFGNVKLGGENCKPEHSTFSWLAMLFCGGTGIGLVFWSIAEPLSHYSQPIEGITPMSNEAADFSIKTVFMHWGILPWVCFAVVGLCVAYFKFNKNKSLKISSTLTPIFGEKMTNGWVGKIVDIFTVLVSVAGVATSLGLGCIQICGGFEYLFGVTNNWIIWLAVILIITAIFLTSAATGVNKGIKVLSKINVYLALILLFLGFVIGPKESIVNSFVNGIGQHLGNFIQDSLKINPWETDNWILNWRVFYWAWWIAWAPFVGMFIAKISKGRTIKQFIICSILIPTLFTFIWFAVFGTLSIKAVDSWELNALIDVATKPETAVYVIFEQYPLSKILSVMVIILLIIFFITSADSATLSLSIMSSCDENPPFWKKLVWALVEASMAFVLLLAGSLKPLQTISIVAALPFLIIMILMLISLILSLKKEKSKPISRSNLDV